MTTTADSAATDPERGRVSEITNAYLAVERTRRIYTGLFIVLAIAALVSGLRTVDAANAGQFWERLEFFFDYPVEMIGEALAVGWSWFILPFQTPEHPALRVPYVVLLLDTVLIALASTFLGFIFAFVITFFASRNLVQNKALVWILRRFLDVSRAFPEIVIALFLIYLIGANPIVAVVAVAFHSIGALGKLFSEVVENADMRPLEGLQAAGANWTQRVWFGMVPQVMPNFLSYTLLRLEINVRASAILGFIGAGGLGAALKVVVDVKYGADVAAILAMLIGTIFVIDYISARLRRRLIGLGGH